MNARRTPIPTTASDHVRYAKCHQRYALSLLRFGHTARAKEWFAMRDMEMAEARAKAGAA